MEWPVICVSGVLTTKEYSKSTEALQLGRPMTHTILAVEAGW